ncbi:uncharacterized protein LAESUDRAFT_405272 [Laetiporus sulphureus 93-53]|uniref:Metal homeostatis protein bsd2 n=1 Tax=Laetiporus sulphureus 93-53 TaxID=1314785 RepID=A0A165CD92_9APHY|nr:uncharacterized protein LAESUDRAFT_405272 [Laetiporus sulphureus 93-53]KZT02603.1 hypothetical protein LAESUDRAFT_405272 [Laetiporus sulphureus 93-53]
MPAGYAPLPNPRSEPEAERELEDAFEDDDEHHTESTPLTHGYAPTESLSSTSSTAPGAYDFEREYDYPPPGSPPSPSPFALPNNIGNTNGELPSTPVRPTPPRPSFLRRAVGALLPQYYTRVPTELSSSRRVGGGEDNDGVFANVMAKPGRSVAMTGQNGEVIMVPEEAQNDLPPSYNEAQADAVPTYWETTVHAPSLLSANGEMLVDDLPTGSLIFFITTAFISYFFQFVGFVLTYLLHSTHAAKYGSRAGLGLTMIQYGFYSRSQAAEGEGGQGQELVYWNKTTGIPTVIPQTSSGMAMLPNGTMIDVSTSDFGASSREWMSLLLIVLGWLLFLSSVIGFYRVKRWEKSIRDAANQTPLTPEQIQRDVEVRRNIERVFGILDYGGSDENDERRTEQMQQTPMHIPEADMRMQRDLREAGLL